MFSLEGKKALITGASGGIGSAIARVLHAQGAEVTLSGTRQETLESLAHSLKERCHIAVCNLNNSMAVEALVPQAEVLMGQVDILVNNAGISGSSVGDMLSLEGWNQLMSINATGVFLGTTLVGQVMAGQGKGSIVNISSIMGFVSSAEGHPGYSASKGAVRLLTKNAAVRWGPQGVRVNSVHPGYLPPMLGGTNGPGRSAKIPLTPLRRLGEAIEVAYGVLFLASDEASFITGTELVIDGGFIAQ